MVSNKKAQGEVIGTILIILIVMASVAIVMQFVIPFVQNQLEGSKCFDVKGIVSIKNSEQYTCYNTSTSETLVQVHFGDSSDKLKGFAISLGGASSSSYKIFNFGADPLITMYNRSAILVIPGDSEDQTYRINNGPNKPESITVYPILANGKLCDASDMITSVNNCLIIP